MILISKDYRNMTDQFIKTFLLNKFNQLDLKDLYHDHNLNVQLKCYNSFGDEGVINFKDAISFKLTPYFFVIRLKYSNIYSNN